MNDEPEARHRACWYGRRTPDIPPDVTVQTIEDGHLLYCAHPMLFPVVGYRFDVRNCVTCDFFRPGGSSARSAPLGTAWFKLGRGRPAGSP